MKILSVKHISFYRLSVIVVSCFLELMVCSLQPGDKNLNQSAVLTDARLVDGDRRCSGRLEMKNQGEWRTLIISQTHDYYEYERRENIMFGQVACRQMGCGSAVSFRSNANDTERPAWEVHFTCSGREFTLKDCKDPKRRGQVHRRDSSPSSYQVTCSESVRLVGESSICQGGVEVKTDQGWAAVCEDGFDSKAQELFCKELGCGKPRNQHWSFITGEEPALSKHFQCIGNETHLADCAGSIRKDCKPAVGISCTSENVFRLGEEEGSCNGRLEGRVNGEWRPVADLWYDFREDFFNRLCGKLGCGSFKSSSRIALQKTQPVWTPENDCWASSSFCTSWRGRRSELTVTAACSEAVKLGNEHNGCEGVLGVKTAQSWAPLCSTFLTPETALVICQELECGFPESFYGRNLSSFLKNTGMNPNLVFNCSGTEKALMDCPLATVSITEKERGECIEAHVICKKQLPAPAMAVHTLQDLNLPKSQVFKGHRFAIRCSVHSHFSILSFRLTTFRHGKNKTERIQPSVDQEAIFFFDAAEDKHQASYRCEYNYNLVSKVFSQPQTIYITVKEPNYVRLVGEVSRCAGRLELEYQKEWRPVSDRHTWSLKEAALVCRQLKCGSAVSTRRVDGSTELRPAWHLYSDCVGTERALMDCGTVRNSTSSSTVEVVCSEVLLPPKKPVFSVMSSLNNSNNKDDELLIFKGHSFTISCSVEPKFPGGHFSLKFADNNKTHSVSQPAVNHTARFLFRAADESNRGNYSCVYHNFVFNHNFSSESQKISLNLHKYLDVTLDDGVNRNDDSEACAGKLLVGTDDGFLELSADSAVWDLKHASVVCRQLGCGSAVSTKGVSLPSKTRMARLFSDCNGSESALLDCGTVLPCFASSAAEVVCTGHKTEAEEY